MIPSHTRTSVHSNHALICPDSHVPSPLPGWTNAKAVVVISPHLGARFTQFFLLLEPHATSALPPANVQRFFYVQEGAVTLTLNNATHTLTPGHYAYLPANTPHTLTSTAAAKLTFFEKNYQPLPNTPAPTPIVGNSAAVPSTPFLNDPHARLQLLLPDIPSFDMAVNLFTFDPGATLPLVETHIMEHGLLMTQGQGLYRLGDHYYPVTTGDVIWMASYCPQWFAALNPGPSQYLYYKDINRHPLS